MSNKAGNSADSYAYAFDDIGNRLTAEELAAETEYATNNLNQYSQIAKEGEALFVPTFDDDGNQTLVKTSTGIWTVEYNGENRPVKFTNGTTVVECKYDSLGRRCEKKVSVDGETTFHQRHAYRNYLQIAAFDVSVDSETEEEVLSLATTTAWDPMEPQATRPLAFTDHSGDAPATYFHTHDLTKNVCELIDSNGAVVSACDYAPFGAVAISGIPTRNPFQFSSEVYDPETALVYYNYRHYNPIDGRWISRDILASHDEKNLYCFSLNRFANIDLNGLKSIGILSGAANWILTGEWEPKQEVLDAAMRAWTDSFGGIFLPHGTLTYLYTGDRNPSDEVFKASMESASSFCCCWSDCMKKMHSHVGRSVKLFLVFASSFAASTARIKKRRIVNPKDDLTSLSRELGRRLNIGKTDISNRSMSEALGRAMGRSTAAKIAKGVTVTALLTETILSAYCSYICDEE